MATAPRSFRRAARKTEARPITAFTLDWVEDLPEEGEEGYDPDRQPEVLRSDIFHATRPTEERMFLTAAMIGDDSQVAGEAAAVMELFRDVLPTKEYRVLRERLADPEDSVDLETLQDVLEWLMEDWTSFPTQPSQGSSPSPTSTGTKSTGRVRGPGSTHSGSLSNAS